VNRGSDIDKYLKDDKDSIRIFSARKATKNEKKGYGGQNYEKRI